MKGLSGALNPDLKIGVCLRPETSASSVESLRPRGRHRMYQQREESERKRRTMKCCRKKKIACYWIACSFIFLKRVE